jgi:copper(I)-binding protein
MADVSLRTVRGVRAAGRTLVIAAALVMTTLACHRRDEATSRAFQVEDAWIRAAADSGATTAAYMRLVNGGDAPVTVSHVTVEEARATELHETVRDANHMLSMEPRDSIVVPAHDKFVLQPGGSHVMVIGTTRPLVPGDKVRLTMRLSTGAIVAAYAAVRAP